MTAPADGPRWSGNPGCFSTGSGPGVGATAAKDSLGRCALLNKLRVAKVEGMIGRSALATSWWKGVLWRQRLQKGSHRVRKQPVEGAQERYLRITLVCLSGTPTGICCDTGARARVCFLLDSFPPLNF